MCDLVRMVLLAPSAAMMNREFISEVRLVLWLRIVDLTPSILLRNRVSSVRHSTVCPSDLRCLMRIFSVTCCSRIKTEYGVNSLAVVKISNGIILPFLLTKEAPGIWWPAFKNSSTMPICSKSSKVRGWMAIAFECFACVVFLSIIRNGMPNLANWQAAIRPVGPAPTISTCGVEFFFRRVAKIVVN